MEFFILVLCILPAVNASKMDFGAHRNEGPISILHLPHDTSIFNKFLKNMKPGNIIKTYTATDIMVSSIYSRMDDEKGLIHQNMDNLCYIVPILERDCRDHPESCRNSRIQLETVERAMENGVKTLNYLNYVCDIGDRPDTKITMERCSEEVNWRSKQPFPGNFTLETNKDGLRVDVLREKRFIFSTSFIISALVGFLLIPSASAAVVVGVKDIANSKNRKIVAIEAKHRNADKAQGWRNDVALKKVTEALGGNDDRAS